MPNHTHCLFCQIAQHQLPSYTIFEDHQVMAFLDIYPQSQGHILIIPKKHSFNMLDTGEVEIAAIHQLAKKICQVLTKALPVTDFLIKSHNGPLAGQEIDHFHLHIIPYYSANQKTARIEATKQELQELQKIITSHFD